MSAFLGRDFFVVMVSRVLTALIAIISVRIMTALLAPLDYGQWVLLIGFQTFCGLFLINPLDQHVFRHAHAWWDGGQLLAYMKKFEKYVLYVSFFIFLVVFGWAIEFDSMGDASIAKRLAAGLIVASIVYVATSNMMYVTLLNVLGYRIQSAFFAILTVLLSLGTSVALTFFNKGAIYWILGQAFGAAVGAYFAKRALARGANMIADANKNLPLSDFLSRSTFLAFCVPLAAATGFMWLQYTGYKFWIDSIWGAKELGYIAVGLGITSQLAAIVESLAMQFLYPYFSRCISDAKSDMQISVALSDLMNVLAPIYAIWAGFNAVCSAALLEILTDSRYHIATRYVIFGALIEYARCTTNLWSNSARAIRRTRGLIPPYALGAVVVLIGAWLSNWYFHSITALAISLVVAGAMTVCTMIFFMQRIIFVSVDVPRYIFGFLIMGLCTWVSIYYPIPGGDLLHNMLTVFIGGVISCLLAAIVLRRNHALGRLLESKLGSV